MTLNNDQSDVENYLKPVCMILLSLNQRHIVEKYLKLIYMAEDNIHNFYYIMFKSYLKTDNLVEFNKSYKYLEALEDLPVKEAYDCMELRLLSNWRRSQLV